MLTRRSMMLASIAAGVIDEQQNRLCQSGAARDAGEFRRARRRLRLPHPHPRAIPRNSRSSPAASIRPNWRSPEEMTALHKALHMERVVIVTPSDLRHRQLGHAVRHGGARRDRARRRRDRRQDVGERSRRRWARPAFAASASTSQPAASTIRTSAGRAFRPRSSA